VVWKKSLWSLGIITFVVDSLQLLGYYFGTKPFPGVDFMKLSQLLLRVALPVCVSLSTSMVVVASSPVIVAPSPTGKFAASSPVIVAPSPTGKVALNSPVIVAPSPTGKFVAS
jgi:hypothetical protein